MAVKTPKHRYIDVAPKAVVQESTAAFGVYRYALEEFAWTHGHVEKDELERMYKFKLARVQKVKNGDSIVWLIQYYVWDVQRGVLVRKRHRVPVVYKAEDQKKAYFTKYIKKINDLLKKEYCIDREKLEERK